MVFHPDRSDPRWWYVIQVAPRSKRIFEDRDVVEGMVPPNDLDAHNQDRDTLDQDPDVPYDQDRDATDQDRDDGLNGTFSEDVHVSQANDNNIEHDASSSDGSMPHYTSSRYHSSSPSTPLACEDQFIDNEAIGDIWIELEIDSFGLADLSQDDVALANQDLRNE